MRNKLSRQRRPHRIVFVRYALPACVFEASEVVTLHVRHIVGQALRLPSFLATEAVALQFYSRGNSIGSSSWRGTSLFRAMMRAQVFQRRIASSWPGGRSGSAF